MPASMGPIRQIKVYTRIIKLLFQDLEDKNNRHAVRSMSMRTIKKFIIMLLYATTMDLKLSNQESPFSLKEFNSNIVQTGPFLCSPSIVTGSKVVG